MAMRRFMQLAVLLIAPIAVFAAMLWADRTFGAPGRGRAYVIESELPPVGGEIGLPKIEGPMDPSRPLVLIDPGHGGHDPGAGQSSPYEKELVLGLARALRDELLRQGGVRVALSRADDTFLVLAERGALARRINADLFVSIHADSTEGEAATGATIYTLSAKGSSEVAERLAQRENRAGTINGVSLESGNDAVNAILVDLSQREMQVRSEEFGGLILREGRGRLPFRETTVQSAAFAVLKSPDVPSVLFESGYINNPVDADRLASSAGRMAFAQVTARAIRIFFARRTTQ
jgi:N-acetylmuramoyl-L-alanine amidase